MHPQPVPIPRCPRCLGEHPPCVAMPFERPVGEFPSWLICPATFQPVLVRITRMEPVEDRDHVSKERRQWVETRPVYELI